MGALTFCQYRGYKVVAWGGFICPAGSVVPPLQSAPVDIRIRKAKSGTSAKIQLPFLGRWAAPPRPHSSGTGSERGFLAELRES